MKANAAARTTRQSGKTTVLVSALALGLLALGLSLNVSWNVAAEPGLPAVAAPSASDPVDGKELFTREWLPNDARARGGDGLGPLFNDSSCVACHNLGGVGGGGPKGKN